jgi:hypothetical protein
MLIFVCDALCCSYRQDGGAGGVPTLPIPALPNPYDFPMRRTEYAAGTLAVFDLRCCLLVLCSCCRHAVLWAHGVVRT